MFGSFDAGTYVVIPSLSHPDQTSEYFMSGKLIIN